MYTNVNLAAPVGVLTFLGTAFLLGVIALIVLHALITHFIIGHENSPLHKKTRFQL